MGFTEYGYARKTKTTPWDEAHFYRECSNKGLCDRETGLCECFPGYEGAGCRRTACPQDCNGNGICRTILESDRKGAKDYSAWDGEKTQLCVCDPGFTGPACSLRSCPKGADPVVYNYKITDSVQGIYFRTFAPDKRHFEKEESQHKFLKDKPSKVYFTITYTDEYNDEWTTAITTLDYTTFCQKTTGSVKGAICLSTPTLNYDNTKDASTAVANQPTRDTLQRMSEQVNASLLALPSRAISSAYVWSAGNSFDVVCDGGKTTSKLINDLPGDVKACIDKDDIHLKPRAFQTYPWLRNFKDDKDKGPTSPYVNSLDFRLDMDITGNVNQIDDDGNEKNVDFDGTDTKVFGLALFVKLPGPGVSVPLQVRYWYTPTAKIGDKLFSYSHVEGTSTPSFTADNQLFLKQSLVVIQDLVPKRKWNPDDGDSALEFSKTTVGELPYCSNRGICDFESGICNCFSGYTGLRCDTQNAVTYSY